MFMVMENECRHNTSQMESVINYFCIILKRYDWRRIVNKHYFDFSFVWPFLFEARFFNGFLSIKSFVFRVYLHFLGTRYRCNVYIYIMLNVFVLLRNTVWTRVETFNLRLKSQYLQWCVWPEKIKIHSENSF